MKYFFMISFILISFFLMGHVNIEKEIKNMARPVGHIFHELKMRAKEPFESPEKNYNYVRADTFFQIHSGVGRVGRTELAISLPDRSALGKRVKIYYPPTGRVVRCRVRNIGPWFTRDPYWKKDRRPLSELRRKNFVNQKITYPSGISLTPQVWYKLGINRKIAFSEKSFKGTIGWRFIYD